MTGLGGRGAQGDEQVGLSGAGVPDQAQRRAGGDPAAGGQGVDGGGVDVRVRGVVEVLEPFRAGEAGVVDAAGAAAGVAVVALGEQQLGEEPGVAVLLAFGDGAVISSTRARTVGRRSARQAASIAVAAASSVTGRALVRAGAGGAWVLVMRLLLLAR